MGEAQEINPSVEENRYVYEIDTNKTLEVFRQEYKIRKSSKIKIEIERIE